MLYNRLEDWRKEQESSIQTKDCKAANLGRYSTTWVGTVQHGQVQYKFGRYSTTWTGTVQHGQVQYNMSRYSTTWAGTVLPV